MVASITSTTVAAVSDVADAASATVHVVADVAEKTSAAVTHAVADSALLDKDVQEKLYPDPNSFSAYQHSIYANFRPPAFTTDPGKWEELARKKIPHGNFWYAAGSAGLFRTAANNLDAFNRYRLRNRMFVDATVRDCSVELFGQRYESPLLVGPIGVQEIFHKDAEEAVARACRKTKVPMVLSMAASRTIEQVAAANGDGPRWFQLYWPKPGDDDITASMLRRAWDNGYRVLVVTADTFMMGWRPADLDGSYLPFCWGKGCQIGFSDPVFNAKYAAAREAAKRVPPTKSLWERIKETLQFLLRPRSLIGALRIIWHAETLRKSQMWLDVTHSGTFRTWKDIPQLRKDWPGPIVIKGISTVDDAHRALDAGVDGIVVSNHGGRHVDGGVASIDALAEITSDKRVKESNLTILFDSGVRTGSDALKAMALGAKACLIARPYIYGLSIAGEQGVEHVLRTLLADIDLTLSLMGKPRARDMNRDDLQILPMTASAIKPLEYH